MVYPVLAAAPPPLVQPSATSASIPPSEVSAAPVVHGATTTVVPYANDAAARLDTDAAGLGEPLSVSASENDQFVQPTENPKFSTTVITAASTRSTSTTSAFFVRPTGQSYSSDPRVAQPPQTQLEPSDRPDLAPGLEAAPSTPAPVPSTTPDLAPTPSPDLAPTPPPSPNSVAPNRNFVELAADQQEYDTLKRVVTAVGNVLLNYRAAQLKADRVQTLVGPKQVIAEGNVQLTRGEQVLQGDRLEYQLDQNQGVLFKPSGVINLPTTREDLSPATPATNRTGNNPLTSIRDSLQLTAPAAIEAKDGLQRLRFEADRIEFTGQTWTATNVRITSDPFSPPELEVRADQAQLQRISSQEDVVTLKRPRLVFDQQVSLPIPRSKIVLSRKREDPFSVNLGFDDRDRGGLYVGRQFTAISDRAFTLSFTPQIFVQRAILEKNFNFLSPDVYGLDISLKGEISERTKLGGYVALRSFDFSDFANNVRAGLRLAHSINEYQLAFEAAYRERVFNGSLGEQTIQSRAGIIFNAPTRTLGKTGIELRYRLSAEYITAQTDPNLFGGTETLSLGRFQGSASLERAFDLWRGKTLPPTATEGLRYTPRPIQPSLQLITGVTGVVSGYSNGDLQSSLIGSIKLQGQFGHFSRDTLDYTGFFVGFSQGLRGGESPFLFDRFVDEQVVSGGFLQQVYGPFRLGFQTSVNLSSGELFNTDIILDYSRRTYGITLRYNPVLQIGSLVFRINSFNWLSNPDPLTGPEVGVVEGGVGQTNSPF
jgi:lipopolysaccharide export system protein LptA